jgi:hypothetical protein
MVFLKENFGSVTIRKHCRRGHLQRYLWKLDDCKPQLCSISSCGYIPPESWSCVLRWRLQCVLLSFVVFLLPCDYRTLSVCVRIWTGAENKTSRVVDIYDANSQTWSITQLSSDAEDLVATSLPNLGIAIFAGGYGMSWSFV